MLKYIVQTTTTYIQNMPKAKRKIYGQFFTSAETAEYMIGLLSLPLGKTTISVLDPGAGTGILSAAFVDRVNNSEIQQVNLTCYENNEEVLPLLNENLEYLRTHVSFELIYTVIKGNYITSQERDFRTQNLTAQKYDIAIGNPPYMKIRKNAPEALAMPTICYGAPNMYFLFMAMTLFNLKANGEMVYIIPRSWTSGAYFKAFREYFLSMGKLQHIHLFISRDKVFEKENVLQETIIIKAKKTHIKTDTITITTSNSNNDFKQIQKLVIPYDSVVAGKNLYVYLVTTPEDALVLQEMESFDKTLPEIGLRMKTGLTVDFRERELIRDDSDENTIPMFYAQHIKNGKIIFPGKKHGEYLLTGGKTGLYQVNSNYLFVKRFTSKEEKRRLQCGIYLSSQFPDTDTISTQNKINFIDNKEHNLSTITVYGLYVLLNSTVYDQYYRILNGSTQVNSTEINAMPVPDLAIIDELGAKLLLTENLTEENCDKILGEYFNGQKGRSKKIS